MLWKCRVSVLARDLCPMSLCGVTDDAGAESFHCLGPKCGDLSRLSLRHHKFDLVYDGLVKRWGRGLISKRAVNQRNATM